MTTNSAHTCCRFWLICGLPLAQGTSLIGVAGCQRKADTVPAQRVGEASARPVHWGYGGEVAPANWGALSPAYAACGDGKAQSPVDLSTGEGEGKSALIFDCQKTVLKMAHHEHVIDIVDNGHALLVTVGKGSTLITPRDVYVLLQFHFHTPSEHTVGGRSFPIEAHFVHQSKLGKFAVVSALFEEGSPDLNLARLIAHFPVGKGESRHAPEVMLDLGAHLPAGRSAFSYLGSFTTPPCTENVEWLVLKQREQLGIFAARLGSNNRPVQLLNGRRFGLGEVAPKTQP